jgi:hypothetical protein
MTLQVESHTATSLDTCDIEWYVIRYVSETYIIYDTHHNIYYYIHYEYTTRCFHPSIALEGGRTAALEEAHETGPRRLPRIYESGNIGRRYRSV